MLKTLFSFTLLLLFCTITRAQSHADSGKHSPVRTLTYQQYQAYLKGEAGDDMAKVAEMNHYPMPDKVLKWRNELDLSPIQIKKITEINTYMHRRRLQNGASVVDTERKLDSLFKYNKMDEGNLAFYATRYGSYQGELKNAILQACLSTEKLLSPQQITRLESLLKPN